MEALEAQIPDIAGAVKYVLAAFIGITASLKLATGIACFVPGRVSWYIVLVSYGWSLAFAIYEVITTVAAGDVDSRILRSVGGILVGIGIWVWLHGDSVRAYYRTEAEPIWRVGLVDASGFVVAAGLGIAVLLMG